MGATTSKEPKPGGSESRGGVTLVNTNNSTAESEVDKYDATSTLLGPHDLNVQNLHEGVRREIFSFRSKFCSK